MQGHDGSCYYMASGHYLDSNSPYMVGVGDSLWNSGKSCGQCLLIKALNGNVALGILGDYCPGGCNGKELDLSKGISAQLNQGNSLGVPSNLDSLTVQLVSCDFQSGRTLKYYFGPGSSSFQWYIVILWSAIPIQSIDVIGSDGKVYHSVWDSSRLKISFNDNGYGKGMGKGSFSLQLRGLGVSKPLLEPSITYSGGENILIKGSVQFPLGDCRALPILQV